LEAPVIVSETRGFLDGFEAYAKGNYGVVLDDVIAGVGVLSWPDRLGVVVRVWAITF
jgi:hypothetical protein